MKDWFPLTDYDFYACVTAGALLIAVVDFLFFGSTLIQRQEWSIPQAVIWIGVAYVVGQIAAAPSSAIIEHLFSRRWLRSPTKILLGFEDRRWRERVIALVFAQHEYSQLPEKLRDRIKVAAAERLRCQVSDLDGEAVFQTAFPVARSIPDSAARLDRFIALYGFARNIAFAALLSAILLGFSAWGGFDRIKLWLLGAAMFIFVGMFGRYMKFYAAYGAEVLRSFGKVVMDESRG